MYYKKYEYVYQSLIRHFFPQTLNLNMHLLCFSWFSKLKEDLFYFFRGLIFICISVNSIFFFIIIIFFTSSFTGFFLFTFSYL